MNLRAFIQYLLRTFPIINRLYFKYRVYRQPLSEKALRGRIQHIGHSIDLKLIGKEKIPKMYENELLYLIGEAKKLNISFDETIQWVLGLLLMAKLGLKPHRKAVLRDADRSASKEIAACSLIDAVKNRRSVRQWTSERVDIDAVISIIDIAKWAPSSCNRQLWKILLIDDEKGIEFAGEYFSSKFVKKAPLLLFVLMDNSLYSKHQRHYAYLDAGGFIQSLLLCIHGIGYGACWLGFNGWDNFGNIHVDKTKYDRFYEFYKLSSNFVPVSLIAIGRPEIVPTPPARQSTDSFVIQRR